MTRNFTGRHMAAILIGFFLVVVAVNLLMARLAGSTFGGVVVPNSYVASQKFNTWLDAAERDRAKGWTVTASRRDDGRVAVVLGGAPANATLTAMARHPLGRLPDTALAFSRDASGALVSQQALPEGRWRLRFEVAGAGAVWRHEADLP